MRQYLPGVDMLRAYDAENGEVLWKFATARAFETVNAVAARGGWIDRPVPTVVNGMVYTNCRLRSVWTKGNVLLAVGVR